MRAGTVSGWLAATCAVHPCHPRCLFSPAPPPRRHGPANRRGLLGSAAILHHLNTSVRRAPGGRRARTLCHAETCRAAMCCIIARLHAHAPPCALPALLGCPPTCTQRSSAALHCLSSLLQDRPWRQQQRRLLAAQFGPREVESLAVNAIVPAPGEEVEGEGARACSKRARGEGAPGFEERGASPVPRRPWRGAPAQVQRPWTSPPPPPPPCCLRRDAPTDPVAPPCRPAGLGGGKGVPKLRGAAGPVGPGLLVRCGLRGLTARWRRVGRDAGGRGELLLRGGGRHSDTRPLHPNACRYFIESAEIGALEINVTVSLSSRLLSGATGAAPPPTKAKVQLGGAPACTGGMLQPHPASIGYQALHLPALTRAFSAPSPALQTSAAGAFNRALGASGFSLVNVANVPIQLGRWVVGNDPANRWARGRPSEELARGKRHGPMLGSNWVHATRLPHLHPSGVSPPVLSPPPPLPPPPPPPERSPAPGRGSNQLVSNGFLSQKALLNNLARHYTHEGLKEAHKVLGGAGPAVASVPLTVLWAGGTTFSLLRRWAGGRAAMSCRVRVEQAACVYTEGCASEAVQQRQQLRSRCMAPGAPRFILHFTSNGCPHRLSPRLQHHRWQHRPGGGDAAAGVCAAHDHEHGGRQGGR